MIIPTRDRRLIDYYTVELDALSHQKKIYDECIEIKKKGKIKINLSDIKNLKLLDLLNIIYPSKKLLDHYKPEYVKSILNNNTGKKGLQNVFENVNSLPFKYKDNEFKNMFDLSILENYSKKIHNICNHINDSIDSVSLVYSERIWSGVVPMAIALEEMGYSRPNKKHNLLKNKKVEGLNYIMITGNKLFSKNNKEEIKHAVQEENKNGSKIKVIIISLAGAEGIDFKFIRNAFIMDPWYNMNRLEQVIGRCIREGSHLSLPPQQRNCCIYLYAVTNGSQVETIDMKVYRMAESKELQISNVSRVIKENAIDCILSSKEKYW